MKITYLLGAGASANALPLIKANTDNEGLSRAILGYINSKKHKNFYGEIDTSIENLAAGRIGTKIFELLDSLASECLVFDTPDIFAKYLLETGQIEKYKYLKSLISAFFFNQEVDKNKFDKRSLTFLTSILNESKFPDEIKIISWNYDTQIEIASEMLDPKQLGRTNFSSWPINYLKGEANPNTPFILHINGVSGYIDSLADDNYCKKATEDLDILGQKKTFLSFAWEEESKYHFQQDPFLGNRLDLAKKMINGTEILVVIGYSFPYFNRKFDKVIINTCRPSLTKVYYQDPGVDIENFKSKFPFLGSYVPTESALGNVVPAVNVVKISDTNNYFIPYEL